MNCTYKLLVYADDVNILGESIHAIKNTEALLVTRMKTGLETNAEKTMYIVMPHEKNAGQYHNIKISIKSSKSVKHLKYFAITLTNQNCIQEEINCILNLGNTCYHIVQNCLIIQYAIQKYRDSNKQNCIFPAVL